MPRAKKVCAKPGCPATTSARLCPAHAREADKARGTTTQRGYGTQHMNARQALASRVATGTVTCARCNEPIKPGERWHLDHTDDRATYLGASHALCNLSAAGKRRHEHE